MKRIFLILISVFLLSGCAVGANPYTLNKNQTTLDLSNNRGVALFTLKIKNPGASRILLSSFTVREANQYKAYNTLGYFSIPLMGENYSASDDLYFCTAVMNRGIYRLDSFNGLTNSFFAVPYTLKADKIFDVYPNTINYMGRIEFGDLDTKIGLMPLKGIEDAYAQDVEKFKAIFPVLKDREIGKDSFY
ncbi:MAG: hypothetical protein M0R17_09945 [Candidatus Omnitrophica bacterium]|jgi:hypothetical protein|nr:hypothetical protein [Candidatus Omnitrophota bacterium]MDD5252357.1 hypothetical protein [Candidatus Omnitrophota bacterium]